MTAVGPTIGPGARAGAVSPSSVCAHFEDSYMLFMVIEHFRPGAAPEVYRRFRDRGRLAPDGLQYVSSWVDFEFQRCFQVMEAPDEAMLKAWTDQWCDLVDFEVVPVRTSAEAAAAIAPRL